MSACKFDSDPILVSDGKNLLLIFGEDTLVIENFLVKSLTATDESLSPLSYKGITIGIVGKCISKANKKQLDYKFPINMTVRELLQTVNKKFN